jgi:hypothetical protein
MSLLYFEGGHSLFAGLLSILLPPLLESSPGSNEPKFGMIHGLSTLASAMSFGSLAIHS